LSNPKDEEESRRKAIVVAEMIERLAKQSAVGREKRKKGTDTEGEKEKS